MIDRNILSQEEIEALLEQFKEAFEEENQEAQDSSSKPADKRETGLD